jgi:cobalamin biosynthesis Mg chelatase CobN
MADQAPNTPGSGEPPKIKLNLDANGRPPTGPRDPVSPSSLRIKATDKKAETTRIDLSLAQPPPPIASIGDTQPVMPDVADVAKKSTVRVDAPPVVKAETQRVKSETKVFDPAAISKQTTMRVEVEEKRKVETTRISLPPDSFQKPGARADADAAESEDVFKRRTIPVGVPTPAPGPATRPKTIQVKKPVGRPADSINTAPAPAAEAVSEAKKSETARIDLPPDAGDRPATRPKTIRIKRPDGTTARKALTIARPSEEEAPALAAASASMEATDEADQPGVVFSILALVALVVACVLVYVLAAQTFAPNLPFPGRL